MQNTTDNESKVLTDYESKLLKFLKHWINNPEFKYYTRSGLCSSFQLFYSVFDELDEFDCTFPFNSTRENYAREVNKRQNPKRIAWVENRIKELEGKLNEQPQSKP